MLRAEQRMRMEQLSSASRDELGLDLETLVTDYGPDQPVPPCPNPPRDEPQPRRPDDAAPEPAVRPRPEQERRLRSAERALAQLGRINPLALEEFSALEERHRFLASSSRI